MLLNNLDKEVAERLKISLFMAAPERLLATGIVSKQL